MLSAGVGSEGASWGAIMAGMDAAICTPPRCCGVFEIRSFIPLSEEISIESTDEPSSISMSFLT